jgi:hypothetical protein
MVNHGFRLFAVVMSSAALLAGCEFSAGGLSVPKATVEEMTMKMITAQVGETSPKVTCPADLKGVVGTVMVCSMPVGDKVADVTLTVTAVEGTNVKWDFKNTPRP